jgi:predicted transcriptional regulator of viral defense system
MKFIDLKLKFQEETIIDAKNIQTVFGALDRRRLFEWQRKGYIKKIVNNFYIFTDAKIDDTSLKIIANKIYSPSYVGLESALSHYGFIPDIVYQITSVTTQKTKAFKTKIAQFSYRTVKPSFFWGYNLERSQSGGYFISDPEKTIMDYFYLNPQQANTNAVEELRLNKKMCRKLLNFKKLTQYLRLFDNARLDTTVKILKTLGYVKP